MGMGSRIAPAFLIGLGLAVGLFIASAGMAQVIHPDQMIGAPSPQTDIRAGESPAATEPAAADFERGFDRPMMAPDSGMSGGSMDTNMLKTPDATDAENARESDSQSSVSF